MNKRNITNIKKGLIISGIALTLFLGVLWALKYICIDTCLDTGGESNYDLIKCDSLHSVDTIHIADYYWKAYNDTILNREYLQRGAMLDSVSKSPNELIEVLNMRNSESKVDFVEITGDTIVVHILNDTFLTQQMGTLGAECYMA